MDFFNRSITRRILIEKQMKAFEKNEIGFQRAIDFIEQVEGVRYGSGNSTATVKSEFISIANSILKG